MRSCASLFRRRRGPAGLRDLFYFCRNCGLYALCSGLSACARHRRYHYPRRALRVAETLDGRLSKRLICRFLRSGGRSSPHDSYSLANTQNFLLAVPVANAFALWYDKFDKLEFDNLKIYSRLLFKTIFLVLKLPKTGVQVIPMLQNKPSMQRRQLLLVRSLLHSE